MTHEVWTIEHGLWLGRAEFYADHMAPDAIMVFPAPTGILHGDAIIAGMEGAPPWTRVEMDDRVQRIDGDVAVIAYRATGHRDDAPPYRVRCGSTYIRTDRWRIAAHQQTPDSPPKDTP